MARQSDLGHMAKVVTIATTPREHWRIRVYSERMARSILTRSPDPAITDPETLLPPLARAAATHPGALTPYLDKLREAGRAAEIPGVLIQLRERYTSVPRLVALGSAAHDHGLSWLGDAALAEAVRRAPNSLRAHELTARHAARRMNPTTALASGRRALELSAPKNRWIWHLFLAEQHDSLGQFAEVADELSEVHESHFDWRDRYLHARALTALGRHERAAELHAACIAEAVDPALPADAQLLALHLLAEEHGSAWRVPLPAGASKAARILRARAQLFDGAFRQLAAEVAPNHRHHELAELRALGLELEGRLQDALVEYRTAISQRRPVRRTRRMVQRMARVAYRLGDFTQAAETQRSLRGGLRMPSKLDPEVDPEFRSRVKQASRALRSREDERALTLLQRISLSTSSTRNSHRILRLIGDLLVDLGQPTAAAHAYARAHHSVRPFAAESNQRIADLTLTERYADHYESLPLDPTTVLYESFHGAKTACNPLAVCLEMLANPATQHLRHVWAIRPGSTIHHALEGHPRVSFVEYGSPGYATHLATAGFLVNNTTFPHWFLRRPGQQYLNTWHGIPWKFMGREVRDQPYKYENTARNMLQATAVVLPDEHSARVLVDTNDVRGILDRPPLVLGAPRVDLTVNLTDTDREFLRGRLGISAHRPTVFYAPTWRGLVGAVQNDVSADVAAITALAALDVNLVVRVHYFVRASLEDHELPPNVTVAPDDLDTNELLGLADVLISDYSSLIFDFAATGRPIVKYVPDLEAYERDRGLYFPVSEVPGRTARTLDELLNTVAGLQTSPPTTSEYSDSPLASLWALQDGAASARATAALLDPPEPTAPQQPRILISMNSLSPTGITQSLRSLLTSLPREGLHVQLALPQDTLTQPDLGPLIAELRASADFTVRFGARTATKQERFVARKLQLRRGAFRSELEPWLTSHMQREFRASFGNVQFDAVIDFDGYSGLYARLAALGPGPEVRRVYVNHNDFRAELTTKYPGHHSLLPILRHFTTVAAVGRAALDSNRTNFAEIAGVRSGAHAVLENCIDIADITGRSAAPLDSDIDAWLQQPGPHLVLVGRLAREKNHLATLTALAELHREGVPARLLCLGTGPLRHEIERHARALRLTRSVFFAGQRSNPYPAIRHADGLVLPSTYEGQGLALIEAMVLGTPVAATRSPGTASVLRDPALGLLVPQTADGIRDALRALALGNVPPARFDAEGYQRDSLSAVARVFGVPLGNTESVTATPEILPELRVAGGRPHGSTERTQSVSV